MPRRTRNTRRRRGRGNRSSVIYYTTTAKATSDASFTAEGFGLSQDRPLLIRKAKITAAYQRPATSAIDACVMSLGLYTPIHSEAVAWTKTRMVDAFNKTTLQIRPPPGTDHGHYQKGDTILVMSIRGLAGTEASLLLQAEIWVEYGPPANPIKLSASNPEYITGPLANPPPIDTVESH